MNIIPFTCPLFAMDIAMFIARVVPGPRESGVLAVARPKTGPWLLSPLGTVHLVEHGGGRFTFVDATGEPSGSAARDVRVRGVLRGLGATIAPPAPLPPDPPAGAVPMSGMNEVATDEIAADEAAAGRAIAASTPSVNQSRLTRLAGRRFVR